MGEWSTSEPPRKVVLLWQITADWQFDPDLAYRGPGDVHRGARSIRLDLRHRDLQRYGAEPSRCAPCSTHRRWTDTFARLSSWRPTRCDGGFRQCGWPRGAGEFAALLGALAGAVGDPMCALAARDVVDSDQLCELPVPGFESFARGFLLMTGSTHRGRRLCRPDAGGAHRADACTCRTHGLTAVSMGSPLRRHDPWTGYPPGARIRRPSTRSTFAQHWISLVMPRPFVAPGVPAASGSLPPTSIGRTVRARRSGAAGRRY